MALTSQQIADILFKKVATGKTDSGSLPFAFFEESINANKSTISKDYWVDASLIPNVNPLASGTHGQTQGVIKVMKTLLLDWIPGTFAFTHSELKDVIPFNYGTNGSYNYQLFLNNGTTVIPMGTNDWYLDPEGGVLTFFNGGSPAFPTGVNSTSTRPRITCWTYVGAKNNPVLTLNESSAGAIADNYVLSSDLRFYSPNIVYVIKVANTNTGDSTININSLGAKAIKKNDDGNLVDVEADDIKAGVSYIFVYDINNDVFQIASGAGGSGNASLKIVDIDTPDWTLNSGVYEFTIANYTVLGFKEIGSVQLWTQISGNDFELVSADFEINRITKELTVKSLTNPMSQLRIMGGGKVDSIASSSGSLYLDDLADVIISTNTLNNGDTLIFNGTNWINGNVITDTILTDTQMYEGADGTDKLSYVRKGLLMTLNPQQHFIEVKPSVEAIKKSGAFDNSNGNGWIGTKQGLIKLDYSTLNTNLYSYQSTSGFGNSSSSNIINDIKFQVPNNNNLILSTQDGVIIWNRTSNSFSTLATTSGIVKFYESCSNEYDYNAEIYFATENGILRYNTSTNAEQLYKHPTNFGTSGHTSNYFLSIYLDSSNALICAMTGDDTSGNGGYFVTRNLSTLAFSTYCYPTTTGFGISNNSNFVNSNKSISRDFNGNIWLGTKDGLIRKTGASTFTTYSYPTTTGFGSSTLSNNIICMSIDNNGDIWFGNNNGEVVRVNTNTYAFTTYTFPGFTEFYDCDKDGSYITFIGNAGVIRIDVYNLPNYTIIPISNAISVVALASAYPNSVVVGTSTNIMKLDNKVSGTINIKTSANTHTFNIDNSSNTPDINNNTLSSNADYLNAISNFIDTNYSSDFITEIKNDGTKTVLIIYRIKTGEGTTPLTTDEVVELWVDSDLVSFGDIKHLDFQNDYQATNYITPPTSEQFKSNFGVSYKPKPGSSLITIYDTLEYYYDYVNDVWTLNDPDLTPYALKPSSYTTNNLMIMDTAGEQLVDSGINISLFGNKYHKVAFVDSVNGNDSTGQKGSILKPYKTITPAFNASSSGDLIFLMPGIHDIGNGFGMPLGNGIDYYFLNADVTFTGYAALMGPISSTISVTCKIFGKGSFRRTNNSTPDTNPWAIITPYTAGLNLNIDGIDFYAGNYPFIGTIGQLDNASTSGDGSYIYTKKINIKNSRIETNDNTISIVINAGNMPGNVQLTLENCYFKGLLMATTDNIKNYPYVLKATNTIFEAGTNSNGLNYSVAFLDYYNASSDYKAIFERCTFKSTYGNLSINAGFGGTGGTNKHLYIYDCKFTNDSQGWIVNEITGVDYKLINNWSQNSNTGTYVVTNLISGSGFIVDSGLELF